MHIEPGYVQPAKVAMANVGALGVLAWAAKEQIKDHFQGQQNIVWNLAKTAVAAVALNVFMQSFSMHVGPSELHFIGAMALYLTLGFWPVLMGFAVGLLLQGLVFSPWDLVNLGVNSLSLMLPLIMVHFTIGRNVFDENLKQRLNIGSILKLDAVYYSGVTSMVGFWLWVGDTGSLEHAFASWLAFASSYLVVVALEPVLTWSVVMGLKKVQNKPLVKNLFVVHRLTT